MARANSSHSVVRLSPAWDVGKHYENVPLTQPEPLVWTNNVAGDRRVTQKKPPDLISVDLVSQNEKSQEKLLPLRGRKLRRIRRACRISLVRHGAALREGSTAPRRRGLAVITEERYRPEDRGTDGRVGSRAPNKEALKANHSSVMCSGRQSAVVYGDGAAATTCSLNY
ncbi:hypothetical protein J6590_024486 [Homalodisca vitripennis]|nr:hypothetical protein J6590_024486 [Homalodisca vitripennis]